MHDGYFCLFSGMGVILNGVLKSRLLVTRLNIDMLVSKQHGSTSLGVNDGNEPIF